MWFPTSKRISAPSWSPRSMAQASRKLGPSVLASTARSSSSLEIISSSRRRRWRTASGLRTKRPLREALPREPPLRLAVGLEVPPAGPCPGDELRLDVRIAREKAGTALDNLVDQDDRRDVEGDQLYGRPRGLPQIGLPARQLVEGQGRFGEDAEIHVANPGTASVQRRAEDVDEQDPSVPREQLGSVPGSSARLRGSERVPWVHRPRKGHGALNPL